MTPTPLAPGEALPDMQLVLEYLRLFCDGIAADECLDDAQEQLVKLDIWWKHGGDLSRLIAASAPEAGAAVPSLSMRGKGDDLAYWINELGCLGNHPDSMASWTRSAIKTIYQKLMERAEAPPAPGPAEAVAWRCKDYLPWLSGGYAWRLTSIQPEPDVESEPLYAAPAAAPVGGWLDIESAPRDGTFVLCANDSGHRVILQFCRDGYWRNRVNNTYAWNPTHWQPLPAAPRQDGDAS